MYLPPPSPPTVSRALPTFPLPTLDLFFRGGNPLNPVSAA